LGDSSEVGGDLRMVSIQPEQQNLACREHFDYSDLASKNMKSIVEQILRKK
jgi:hypothetical protein